MARGGVPTGQQVAMAKIVVEGVPDDPGLAKALGECAEGLGVPVSGLEVVLVAVAKPHGDSLFRIVERRIYGREVRR